MEGKAARKWKREDAFLLLLEIYGSFRLYFFRKNFFYYYLSITWSRKWVGGRGRGNGNRPRGINNHEVPETYYYSRRVPFGRKEFNLCNFLIVTAAFSTIPIFLETGFDLFAYYAESCRIRIPVVMGKRRDSQMLTFQSNNGPRPPYTYSSRLIPRQINDAR